MAYWNKVLSIKCLFFKLYSTAVCQYKSLQVLEEEAMWRFCFLSRLPSEQWQTGLLKELLLMRNQGAQCLRFDLNWKFSNHYIFLWLFICMDALHLWYKLLCISVHMLQFVKNHWAGYLLTFYLVPKDNKSSDSTHQWTVWIIICKFDYLDHKPGSINS